MWVGPPGRENGLVKAVDGIEVRRTGRQAQGFSRLLSRNPRDQKLNGRTPERGFIGAEARRQFELVKTGVLRPPTAGCQQATRHEQTMAQPPAKVWNYSHQTERILENRPMGQSWIHHSAHFSGHYLRLLRESKTRVANVRENASPKHIPTMVSSCIIF